MTWTQQFIAGGEMGAAVRALDWSATPLGPVEQWSPTLRSAVSTCLESRFPILVWWGEPLIMIYNDAYKVMLADKHPRALGRAGRDVWPEIWDLIGPMLSGVLERGEATWSEDQQLFALRNGFLEETYFTFSYSPIREDSGRIGGVFTAVTESTPQVLGKRRLDFLQRLAAGTALDEATACTRIAAALETAALDVPFALLYLTREDGTLQLAAATGDADPDPAPWRLDEALASEGPIVVDAIPRGLPSPWPECPHTAVVQRLVSAGKPFGVLVTGTSARLRFDDAYRSFCELLAGHVGNAIVAARSYDDERKRAAALAEFDRAKTTFFSNVSHEFRTPLTLLLEPLRAASAARSGALAGDELDIAYRNAQRLLKLVNQLLDFSRIEAHRAKLELQPTDLAALTADLASAFRSAIEQGGLALNVHCPPLATAVHVDPDLWEKIVLNLISNAFKFTFAGEIEVRLTQREVDGVDTVELAVRDTGVGIAEAELARVFERFHRIEGAKSRTHEGTGIGLALVRDLVALHGGSIAVTSELGRGTTFTVSIPCRPEPVAGTPVTAPSGQHEAFVAEALRWLPSVRTTPAPRAQDPATRVLVVDDNADMRDYLVRLLGEHWEVETAIHGAAALAAIRERPPALVVSDVMMPELDGFGLLAALRADPRLATIPVVLLSARAGEEAVADALRAGADDYIVKPFTGASLVVRIEAQLAAMRMRAQAQAVAADERARLYSLLMDAPAAVVSLTGPDMIVELANHKLLEIWGKDRSIIGRPLLDVLPELRDQRIPQLLEQVRTTGIPYQANEFLARLDSNNDGRLVDVYFDFIYAPTHDHAGAVTGILVFAVDVTQKVLTRRELETALGEARNANQAKDEFLALLGHELRNPLAPILTALGLMEMRGYANVGKECAVIQRQTEHLSRLVDDLLDVSRIARGKVELDRKPVELADVMVKSIELASPLFEQKQHHLHVEAPRGLLVDVDAVRMAQVISNLLTNAAKYTERAGTVTLAARRVGSEVSITVRDNGVGISPEVLPHVFDMFVQDRRSLDRSRGGLGLGLTIVKSLVQQHGGRVEARSAGHGHGSTFEIRLPLASARTATTPALEVQAPLGLRAARRVLIVDDNEDAAQMLASAVAELGHDARVAHDGPGALKLVETFTPDVALLDIGLPAMDGYELARLLKGNELLAALRLVALTGYGQASDRDRSRDSGFDAHLVKPVDVRGLVSLIDRLLDN
ncbi:MAG TPA: ATP-binding protein [Kofleriaceae bacterium]|nr:ATP-binding protein [Kofleriaceae bacterium]